MTDVTQILATIDHSVLQDRLGVTPRAIRLARENGKFTANWYAVVSELCQERGIDCPLCLFNFKGLARKHGNYKSDIQGQQTVSVESGAA